ncbi:hypothetical protein LDENG_00075220 [Lucifuga dentata]|nr:hypothetical protein LDENG_00075220 [Lucifuga dentata]
MYGMSTMSLTFFVMMMLLSCSLVIALALHPSREEPAASANSPVTKQNRCQGESLQSIRTGLLRALNLQVEPRLPMGRLDSIRDQWKSTFSAIAHKAKVSPVPGLSAHSVTPAVGDNASLKCCTMASEVFMRDLGWDSWVIYPGSLTMVHCAPCIPEGKTFHCPSIHTNGQNTHTQLLCCQPTSQEMVPILYMDELGTLVISSVQLSRKCGCGPGSLPLPGEE